MQGYLRAAVAAVVLGSGLIGQGTLPGARAADAAAPVVERIFAGLQGGAVATSDDAGTSWQKVHSGLPVGSDVTSLAVAPDGHTIYAGTHGAGVYVSSDDGRNWRDDNGGDPLLSGGQVQSVLVSPRTAS